MAGIVLLRPVARSSSRVAPPQDNQAQVPSGRELHLVANSTWSHGSSHHPKMSVSQQLPLMHTHNPDILEVCGRSTDMKKKREVTFKGLCRASIEIGQNFRW